MSRVSLNVDASKPADSTASKQAAIADVVDALDGATLTGSTLTTSATATADEAETNVGVLGGKVNAILAALRTAGVINT